VPDPRQSPAAENAAGLTPDRRQGPTGTSAGDGERHLPGPFWPKTYRNPAVAATKQDMRKKSRVGADTAALPT
jgi:hypothetical protein